MALWLLRFEILDVRFEDMVEPLRWLQLFFGFRKLSG